MASDIKHLRPLPITASSVHGDHIRVNEINVQYTSVVPDRLIQCYHTYVVGKNLTELNH